MIGFQPICRGSDTLVVFLIVRLVWCFIKDLMQIYN